MTELLKQIKWQFIIFKRNQMISISAAVTVMYTLIFLGVNHLGASDKILTLIILNDPAIIGLFFASIAILIEKRLDLLSAIFVTPTKVHHYILARVIPLTLIGWLGSLAIGFAALGLDFNLLQFSVGTLGICFLACLVGVWMASFEDEFMSLVLKSIPVMMIFFNLPLLNYFAITDFFFFNLMPIQGGITLLTSSYEAGVSSSTLIFGYLSLALWVPVIYYLTYRTFLKRIVNR